VSYELDRSDEPVDSVFKVATSTRMWKPQANDYVVDVTAAAPKAGASPLEKKADPVDTPAVMTKPVSRPDPVVVTEKKVVVDSARVAVVVSPVDSAKAVAHTDSVKAAIDSPRAAVAAAAAPAIPAVDPTKEDAKKIEESFIGRKAILNRELIVESDSVRLSFYDNGEIDGDSISVFVNNQVILTHQELAAKAFNIYLHLDSTREVNEISMFAENLGRLPPNTALMVVTDGKNRYEVFMSSNLKENATIRLRRKR
jgi:hypothetical protein